MNFEDDDDVAPPTNLYSDAESDDSKDSDDGSKSIGESEDERSNTPSSTTELAFDGGRTVIDADVESLLPLWLREDRHALQAVYLYETVIRFQQLLRLTPFRFEDFCAAFDADESSSLLSEIHIQVLKAVLRDAEAQQVQFGGVEQKDSINADFYFMDHATWPEVLKSFFESNLKKYHSCYRLVADPSYPIGSSVETRLEVLDVLLDEFLLTPSAREAMTREDWGYNEHCRVCHQRGDVLCCETCPAVYHLQCMDPPLTEVPEKEWHCPICIKNRILGVYDCVQSFDGRKMVLRQEVLGQDRHGRRYWFLCRRIFIENEHDVEGLLYLSTVESLDELMNALDPEELEVDLCANIQQQIEEIRRQMELTYKMTSRRKTFGDKTYLQMEIQEARQWRKLKDGENTPEEEALSEDEEDDDQSEQASNPAASTYVTRSKTGSLLPVKYNVGELARGTQPKPATHPKYQGLFKLGMEEGWKKYTNLYTTSSLALSKAQHQEEKAWRRHLSYKFSLTQAAAFTWPNADVYKDSAALTANLRTKLMNLSQAVHDAFRHPNWKSLKVGWLADMLKAETAKEFVEAMITLVMSIKPVATTQLWNEGLGHTRFHFSTVGDREIRKKQEKREQKERELDEERLKLMNHYVRYSLGLKHAVHKNRGEEYRIYGHKGWQWLSGTRRYRKQNMREMGLRGGPSEMMVHLKNPGEEEKFLPVAIASFEFLQEKAKEKEQQGMTVPPLLPEFTPPAEGEVVNVSEELQGAQRKAYPKIGKKKGFLSQLLQWREEAEKSFSPTKDEVKEEMKEEPVAGEVLVGEAAPPTQSVVSCLTPDPVVAAIFTAYSSNPPEAARLILSITKEQDAFNHGAKQYPCYSPSCRAQGLASASCFSPYCQRRRLIERRFNAIRVALKQLQEQAAATEVKQAVPQPQEEMEVVPSYDPSFDQAVVSEQFVGGDANVEVEGYVEGEGMFAPEPSEEILEEGVVEEGTVLTEDPHSDIPESYETSEADLESTDLNVSLEIPEKPIVPQKRSSTPGRGEGGPAIHVFHPRMTGEEEQVVEEGEIPQLDGVHDGVVGLSVSSLRRGSTPPVKRETVEDAKVKKEPPSSEPRYVTLTAPLSTREPFKLTRPPEAKREKKETKSGAPFPEPSDFLAVGSKRRSILVLPKWELRRLARKAGLIQVKGFSYTAKNNNQVWPYPAPRPVYRICWQYRLSKTTSLHGVALYLRTLWASLRWDSMVERIPLNNILSGNKFLRSETDDEHVTIEILDKRIRGRFDEVTEYSIRKTVTPVDVDLQKSIVSRGSRESSPARSGLRKRRRADSPASDVQVFDLTVGEEEFELWMLRAYYERHDHQLPLTRARVQRNVAELEGETGNEDDDDWLPEDEEEGIPAIDRKKINLSMGGAGLLASASPSAATQLSAAKLSQVMKPGTAIKRFIPPETVQQQGIRLVDGKTIQLAATGGLRIQSNSLTGAGGQVQQLTPQSIASLVQRALASNWWEEGCSSPPTRPSPFVSSSPAPAPEDEEEGIPAIDRKKINLSMGGAGLLASASPSAATQLSAAKLSQVMKPGTAIKRFIPPETVQQQGIRLVDGKTIQLAAAGGLRIQSNSLTGAGGQVQQLTPQSIASLVQRAEVVRSWSWVVSTPQQQPQRIVRLITRNQTGLTGLSNVRLVSPAVLQNLNKSPPNPIGQVSVTTLPGGNIQVRGLKPGQSVMSLGDGKIVIVNQQTASQAPVTGCSGQSWPSDGLVLGSVSSPGSFTCAQALGSMRDRFTVTRPAPRPTATIVPFLENPNMAPKVYLRGMKGKGPITPAISAKLNRHLAAVIQMAKEDRKSLAVELPSSIFDEEEPEPADSGTPTLQASPQPEPPEPAPVCPEPPLVDENAPPPVAEEIAVETTGDDLKISSNLVASVGEGVFDPNQIPENEFGRGGFFGDLNSLVAASEIQEQQEQAYPQNSSLNVCSLPTVPVSLPTVPVSLPTVPVSLPTVPVSLPTVPVSLPTVPVSLPTVPVSLPTVPIGHQQMNYVNYQKNSTADKRRIVDTDHCFSFGGRKGASAPKRSRPTPVQRKASTKQQNSAAAKTSAVKLIPLPPTPEQLEMQRRMEEHQQVEEARARLEQERYASAFISPPAPPSPQPPPPQRMMSPPSRPASGLPNRQMKSPLPKGSRKRKSTNKEAVVLSGTAALVPGLSQSGAVSLSSHQAAQQHTEGQIEARKAILEAKKRAVAAATKAEVSRRKAIGKQRDLPSVAAKKKKKALKESNRDTPKARGRPVSTPGRKRKLSSGGKNKGPLYCICRKPYDDTNFYVGCDVCSNWFHGSCVGITERQAKSISEYVCPECEKAKKDKKELYCICRKPYDETKFYIFCDQCEDWLHGSCVGILPCEGDMIEEYFCPKCRPGDPRHTATTMSLNQQSYELLRQFYEDVKHHNAARPFFDLPDESQHPNYYRLIKEPMDLQLIDMRIRQKQYRTLRDFIGDLNKIFSNARVYFAVGSEVSSNATALEGYVVSKLKSLRSKLFALAPSSITEKHVSGTRRK
ncbi:unnamed protein product [Cyprideis torosa]|uniref:Uncharacterized protein n=1 Tax=Cyprideis torosa TaxID=163714 RepID=A0A7R8WHM4_9CRUS|nr:unnamed protein product [Cyprideis torosa]CAG0896809.1 unnamed protein product [Cyprideis torosa]